MNIVKRFQAKFDELNILFSEKIESMNLSETLDFFHDYLLDAYGEGFIGASDMLGSEKRIDLGKAKTALNEVIGGRTTEDRIIEYIVLSDIVSLNRVFITEFHRMFNTGINDRAEGMSGLYKTWITMEDDKVRDTHSYLDGITIPSDVPFVTYDGDEAQFPGGFSRVENNANCRCLILLTIAE